MTPKEGPSSLLCLLRAGRGCRGWAFGEVQHGKRHWAESASKESVMLLRGRCSSAVLRGRYRGCCLSTATRTAYHAAYRYRKLCNNVWVFIGEQNLCAVSSKPPFTVLAQRIQNLFLSTYSRFAFNSTSATLSLCFSQNVMAFASLLLNTHVHTRIQSFTTNISMEALF